MTEDRLQMTESMKEYSWQLAVTERHGDTGRRRRGEKARSRWRLHFDGLSSEFWLLTSNSFFRSALGAMRYAVNRNKE
jgi:hypothetical protein